MQASNRSVPLSTVNGILIPDIRSAIPQRYTQSGGVRPFGISTLIVGFDPQDPRPRLYQTEPGGIYSAWKANAIGRSSKTVREFLEKNHKDEMTRDETIKLTIKSLLEVVQTGAKNIEIAVMESYGKVTNLDLAQIEAIVQEIEREKEAGESRCPFVRLSVLTNLQRPNASVQGWPPHLQHRLP